MVHTYTVRDSRRCMRYLDFLGQRNRLAFVGDSRVRQLYAAFVTQFGETVPPAEGEARHKDLEYEDAQLGLHVQFLWRPMVDEMLWSGATRHPPEGLPKLLVIGGATHAIKTFNGSAAALAAYERNVTRLGVVLDQLAAAGMRVLWAIQEPVFYDRLAERRRAITNLQAARYRTYSQLLRSKMAAPQLTAPDSPPPADGQTATPAPLAADGAVAVSPSTDRRRAVRPTERIPGQHRPRPDVGLRQRLQRPRPPLHPAAGQHQHPHTGGSAAATVSRISAVPNTNAYTPQRAATQCGWAPSTTTATNWTRPTPSPAAAACTWRERQPADENALTDSLTLSELQQQQLFAARQHSHG